MSAAVTRWVRTIAQNRLVQFAFFGSILFAVAPRPRSPDTIDITSARLAALEAAETSRGGARALPLERRAEIDQREIEDELLYREGVRLGLDQDDGIVRQRIVQKVLFLAEEVAGASRPPEDAAVRAFFEKNRDRWAIPERVRLAQIFRHGREALDSWRERAFVGEPPVGEPGPIGSEIEEDLPWIASHLSPAFADAVRAAPEGEWTGPLASPFGWHLVRVIGRTPARPARFEEVRAPVQEAYGVFRRQEATAAFITAAFARYRVSIDGKPLTRFTPSRRVAFRSVSSGED